MVLKQEESSDDENELHIHSDMKNESTVLVTKVDTTSELPGTVENCPTLPPPPAGSFALRWLVVVP